MEFDRLKTMEPDNYNKVVLGTCKQKDKLWIRWIHTYYIKGQQREHVTVPKQVSWMVRKILEAKNILKQDTIHVCTCKSVINKIYLDLLGEQPKIPWKCKMLGNAGRLKDRFTQ